MPIPIGGLVAELSANTASWKRDLGKAAQILNGHAAGMNRTLAGIEKSISRIGSAFGVALSGAAVLSFSKGVLDMGEQFSRMSEKTGISVEKLSEFAYGARLANVSTEDMANGLKKLAVNMADASANGGGQMAETFRALGIAVTDSNGKLRDTSTVFEELSKKFAGAEDGPNKVAIAVKLMGKSGEGLIPLLNDLSRTSEEARRLGLVMSTEAAKNAQAFNDEMSKLAAQLQYALLPAITATSKAFRYMIGSDAIDILKLNKQNLLLEFNAITEAANKGFIVNTTRLDFLKKQIEEIDAKINKAGSTDSTTKKTILPVIADTGQAASFQRLLNDLTKSAAEAHAAITLDDRQRSDERLAIAVKEFQNKADLMKLSGDDQIKFAEKLAITQKALAAKAAFDLRSPLEKLTDEWQKTTTQMQAATVNWANSSAEALTNFITTGKLDFKGLADSIIRDLVRIFVQQKIIGSFSKGAVAGTGLLGLLGFAEGGNPPIGRPSIVGENGPELIVPRTATTVIPNGGGMGVNNFYIDARNSDREGYARLEQMFRRLDGSIEHRAVSAWVKDRSRGGITSAFG